MKARHNSVTLGLALLTLFGLGLTGCSSDDPTAPSPAPQDPGSGGGSSAVWTITITPEQGQLLSGVGDSTTVTIQVRNSSTGAAPPAGTTIAVVTTNGTFENGLTEIAASLINGTATIRFVATDPGDAVITAQLESSFGQARITVLDPTDSVFLLSHVDPNVGSPAGGETVSIFGQGFREPVRVEIGGVVAQVLSVTSNRVRVLTPPSTSPPAVGETQPVAVTVDNAVGSEFAASDSLPNGFIYANGGSFEQPQIFSVTPNTGPNEGGTEVVINGSGFRSPVQVLFGLSGGATVEAQVLSVTSGRIRVLSPPARSFGQPNLNEQVDITVVNLESGFRAVAPGAFRYGTPVLLTAIDPSQVDPRGGELVTLYGQGFDEPVTVSVNGVNQAIISVTGTEVVFRTAAVSVNCNEFGVDATGSVVLTNIETNEQASGLSLGYEYPFPQIFSINPNTGPGSGNTPVAITGQNFEVPARVKFGTQTAANATVTGGGTTVSTNSPQFSGFEEEPCDDNADGQQGSRFVPTPVDISVTNVVSGCTATVDDIFVYTPTDTTCRGDVAPPPDVSPQCSNGIDDDGDTFIDFPDDPECTDANDNNEAA